MQTFTTRCRAHNHPEFRVDYDATTIVEADVRWLLSHLERSVEEGTRYEPGGVLQIGWISLAIHKDANGNLYLREPDMKGLPIALACSVNTSLLHMRVQHAVGESLFLFEQLEIPNMLQGAIACTQLGPESLGVLSRVKPEKNDSGWFAGCNDDAHDHDQPGNLTRLSLYEVGCGVPRAIQYFALPAGITVILGGEERIRVLRNDQPLVIKAGSYLQMLIDRERLGALGLN